VNNASVCDAFPCWVFLVRQKGKKGEVNYCTSTDITMLAVTAWAPGAAVVSTWIIHCAPAGNCMYAVVGGVFQVVPVVL